MVEAEDFMSAMAEFIAARKEHDDAFDGYEGWTWGYHGEAYIVAMEDAKARCVEMFQRAVDAAVKARQS
jgi:hypothetical protein